MPKYVPGELIAGRGGGGTKTERTRFNNRTAAYETRLSFVGTDGRFSREQSPRKKRANRQKVVYLIKSSRRTLARVFSFAPRPRRPSPDVGDSLLRVAVQPLWRKKEKKKNNTSRQDDGREKNEREGGRADGTKVAFRDLTRVSKTQAPGATCRGPVPAACHRSRDRA